jgi:hypothetical protein
VTVQNPERQLLSLLDIAAVLLKASNPSCVITRFKDNEDFLRMISSTLAATMRGNCLADPLRKTRPVDELAGAKVFG